MSNWITVNPLWTDTDGPQIYPDEFPNEPGCYAVYLDGELVYVGQTTNLKKRIASHGFNYRRYSCAIQTPWRSAYSLIIKYRPSRRYGDWAMIELRLIKRLQPKFNCVGSVKERRPNAKG